MTALKKMCKPNSLMTMGVKFLKKNCKENSVAH